MARNKKKNNGIYTIIVIILFAIAVIFGEHSQFVTDGNTYNSQQYAENENIINSEEEHTDKNIDNSEISEGENLIVHYFDVGQADSILLQSNGKNMLIDAGTNDMGKTVVKYLQDLGVEKIDYLVGTHPHEDHIGGLDDVINNFEIGTIYMPKVQTDTKTFEDVLDAISNKNLKITSPNVGDKFLLGNTECEIMLCGTGSNEEQNNLNLSSIVIRAVYGEQSFLFTGDAEKENEESRDWSETRILKVGHHGSNTSSYTSFLNQISPEIAIISVGEDNSYGHPKQTIINRLDKVGAKIYRTDQNGTITIICDGKSYNISTSK